MNSYECLHVTRDPAGIVTITIDVPGYSVNVIDERLLRELAAVVTELERELSDPPAEAAVGTGAVPAARAVVFRSGKDSGFIAGADVHRIRDIADAKEAEAVLRRGQDLFDQIEALPVSTVAVIHGPCLGGGLELALACGYRIARDDDATRLGLPETQLGLIPGWGGTQRLPHCMGLAAAARLILQGSRLSASRAEELGLIDAAIAPDSFDDDVRQFIKGRMSATGPGTSQTQPRAGLRSRRWRAWLRDQTFCGRKLVLWMARRKIASQAKHYPALPAALKAIEAGLFRGKRFGLAREREAFCRLLFHPSCRNLLGVFFQQERARKRETWVAAETEGGPEVETVAVVGAGTMGAGIAQIAAMRGYHVILSDIDEGVLARSRKQIEALTQQAVKKDVIKTPAADAARTRLRYTTDTVLLAEADLVIEAVIERLDVKQQVFREFDRNVPDRAILVSNTSAQPIDELAAITARADRVAGLHFFNPVHRMPLVEVVRAAGTSDAVIAALVDFVRRLGKTPLVVAATPGFLVNRILFPYLDEAVRLVCEGLSADDVDRAATRFGMPMGPLELLDAVGLDVAADVSRTLAGHSLDESPTPARLSAMVAAGETGRKRGRGFYSYRHDRRTRPVGIANGGQSDAAMPLPREFTGETISGVQQRLVFAMINAAADSLHDRVVAEPWMVDIGMVLGTGFAPFRGGPFQLIESWGHDAVVDTLEQLNDQCGPRFRPSAYFAGAANVKATPTMISNT